MLRLHLLVWLLFLYQTSQPTTGSIEGIVTRLGTGEPIPKALVAIARERSGDFRTTTTDTYGRYSFENVPPGRWVVVAERAGYVKATFGQRSPRQTTGTFLPVAAGQRLTDIVITLIPNGAIYGRVYNADGEPIANASVQAMKFSYVGGRRMLNTVTQDRTNDLGEYRLFWLAPGQYYVSVTANDDGMRDFPAVSGSEQSRTAPIYYPGTPDPQSAVPIDMVPGANTGPVDLTARRVTLRRIRGRVVGDGPVSSVSLVLQQRRSTLAVNSQSNARNSALPDGTFDFRGVVPGSYELSAQFRRSDVVLAGRSFVEVGEADVENLMIALTPGFEIQGRVSVEGLPPGSALPGGLEAGLRPIDTIFANVASAPLAPDGSFLLRQVAVGDYRVLIGGAQSRFHLKAARLGGTDVSSGFRLEGNPNAFLDVILRPNSANLSGIARNDKGEPLPNATVVLVPVDRARLDLYWDAHTDASGAFVATAIPPGDYKIFVWEDVEANAWQDAEFLRLHEQFGKPLHVGEGSHETVEVRVIPVRQ